MTSNTASVEGSACGSAARPLAFALAVALGLRSLGVQLMASLIIIPATTARYVARGLGSML